MPISGKPDEPSATYTDRNQRAPSLDYEPTDSRCAGDHVSDRTVYDRCTATLEFSRRWRDQNVANLDIDRPAIPVRVYDQNIILDLEPSEPVAELGKAYATKCISRGVGNMAKSPFKMPDEGGKPNSELLRNNEDHLGRWL